MPRSFFIERNVLEQVMIAMREKLQLRTGDISTSAVNQCGFVVLSLQAIYPLPVVQYRYRYSNPVLTTVQ